MEFAVLVRLCIYLLANDLVEVGTCSKNIRDNYLLLVVQYANVIGTVSITQWNPLMLSW